MSSRWATSFSSCLTHYDPSLWNASTTYTPITGTLLERAFKILRYNDVLTQRCSIDPVRLRHARILLQWYNEQLRKDPQTIAKHSNGRGSSSIALDTVQDMYCSHQCKYGTRDWNRCRGAIKKHIKVGKRWALLVKCLGPGSLLACSLKLATEM
jgi:hypothetical protein